MVTSTEIKMATVLGTLILTSQLHKGLISTASIAEKDKGINISPK